MAKLERFKKQFVSIVLFALLTSQPGVSSLFNIVDPAGAQVVASMQNETYPHPSQCNGANWNIGAPDDITCSSSVTTNKALERDARATSIFGASSRLKPDLPSLNQFCREYTGDSTSYATYARVHNYCNGCDQRLAWWSDNAWHVEQACYGKLNVQWVTCSTSCATPACSDGIDNDGDGATDYPDDFSCSSPTDNDETNPKAACQDGIDNDHDGRTDYPDDPGCSSSQDNSEAGEPQCQDGIDNDGDGATDYPDDFSCSSPTDNDETNPKAQCQDGIDNDGDGLTDYPNDPGCSSKQDNDEHNICPAATSTSTCRCATNSDCTSPDTCQSGICRPVTYQCNDGIDNDGDGATDYPDDFSCSSPTDNDETNPKAACQDGIDNDHDGRTDYPDDPGCSSSQDNSEAGEPQCQDGIDNDGDGAADYPNDFSCSSPTDNDETNPKSQCQDGIDNDGNGYTDYPADTGCSNNQDNTESGGQQLYQCNDGIDNDGDGATDYPNDFSCSSATDNDETSPKSQCQDGIDNDGDGVIDYPNDPGCSSRQDNDEHNICPAATSSSTCRCATNSDCTSPDTCQSGICRPVTYQCNDGIDNDGDGATDYPNDFSCSSTTDNDETNPKAQCQDGIDNDHDGRTDYPDDPGCSTRQDNDEHNICPAATSTSTCRCATNTDCTNPDTCQGGYCRPTGADLSVSKTGQSTIVAGSVITYTVTAANAGPATATNVVIADVIPSGLTFNAGQSSTNCVQNGSSILCNNFSLTAGQSRTFTIAFNVPSTLTCGNGNYITNQATVSSSSQDPNSSNNTSQTVSTGVQCPTPTSDLSIVKTGPDTVLRGDTALYTVTATNNGPATATNVVITDVIPSGFTFNAGQSSTSCVLNGAGTSVLCNNFSLNAGESRSFTIAFSTASTLSCGTTIRNTASVSSSSVDPVTSNNSSEKTTTVTCPTADVSIVKSGPQRVRRGSSVLYTVTVTNQGPNRSDNVVVVDRPESMTGLVFNRAQTDSDCVLNGVEVLCNNVTLQSGQSRTYNIVFTVNGDLACGATIANRANVNVSTPDPHGDNNWSDRILTVVDCTQCSDGIDNDQDGATDYPADFSCSDALDDDETNPRAQCQDGIDNDQDGATDYPGDAGCSSLQDNDETNPASPDASITKSGPVTVIRGSTVAYTLAATNVGTATAQNVVVSDVIPAGLTFNPSLSSPECVLNGAGTSVLCNNFSLTAGQTRTFTVNFTVGPSVACGANIQNNAAVSTSNDTNTANNAGQWNTAVQCPNPTFSITKTDHQTVVEPGATLTYTVSVTNTSQVNASNVTVTDTLPGLVAFLNASDGGTNNGWTGLSIAAGQTKVLTMQVQVNAQAPNGSILTNSASVSGQTAQDQTTVQFTVQNVDLTIQKTGPATVNRGGTVSYGIIVTNIGTATALNAVVADVIPPGLTFAGGLSSTDCLLNGAGTSVLCNNFSLAAGQTKTFTITFNVLTTVTCNAIVRNTATVSTSNDMNGGNNTSQTVSTTVLCPVLSADLQIQKSVHQTSVNMGGWLNYTLTVTNAGPENASQVVISDSMPAGTVFDMFTQTNGFDCYLQPSDTSHMVCVRPTMVPGETAVIRYRTRVLSTGPCIQHAIVNTAAVNALSSTDPNAGNNYSQASVQLSCPNPTFVISKTDNRTTAQPNEILTYTVSVTNTSQVNASNVTVTDTLPGLVAFLNASDGGTNNGWTGLSIAAGQTKILTMQVQVNAQAPNGSILTNSASVSGQTAQDQTTVFVPVVQADLLIIKNGPALVQRGNTILYTVTAYNAGPGSSQDARITDPIPAGLLFNQSQSSAGCSQIGMDVVCPLSLTAGQSQSFTLAFTVPTTVECGRVIVNTATVSSANDPNCANDVSSATTAVQCLNPTYTITKTDGQTTVQPGGTLTYSISVTNTSTVNAPNVTVTDTLPSSVTFLNASDGGMQAGGVVTWSGLSIAAGATKTLTVQVQVSTQAADGTVLINFASVAGVSAQDATTVQVPQSNADLSIIKTGPQTVQQGSVVLYSLTVFNAGPQASQNVVISDVIPAGLTWNSAQTSSGCVLNGGGTSVLCNNFTLTAGQNRSFTVAFNVPTTVTCSAVIQNTATVSTSNDSNSSNNISQTIVTTVQCPTPTFSITKTDNQTTVQPGGTLTYQIFVTNTSQYAGTNVTVTDTLPSSVTFLNASDGGTQTGGMVTWSGLSIAAGQTKALTVQVQVSSSASNGTVLTNTAQVAGVSAQDTTTVQTGTTGADLSITKTGPQTVQQGDVILYTLTAYNAGPQSAQNVVVADVVPAGLTFNQAQSSSGCVLNGGGTSVLCNNFTLTAGQNRSFTVAFTVTSAAVCNSAVLNTATISTSNDPNGANNTSQTVSTFVQCAQPTFSITKTDGRSTVLPGESLTYQITVTNTSATTASNVQVTDALPGGVTYVTSSDSGVLNGATVLWTLPSLAAGVSKTLIVIVTVPSTASNGTIYTNIAIAGSATAQDTTTVNTGGSSSSSSSSSSECNLTVTLRDSQDPVDPDEDFTYTIEVRNNNGNTVNNVSLTQTLDSNVNFLSTTGGGNDDAGNTIRWTGLSIGGYSTQTFTTSVRVRSDRDGVTIRSNAFACNAQDSENTQVTGNDLPPPPPPPPPGGSLTLDKQADRTEAQAGSIIAYTIAVRNVSSVAVGPVTIEDTFSPSDMTVEDAGGGMTTGGSIQWDLGTLGANATRLIHYRVRLNQTLQHGQTVSNTAQVMNGNASDTAQVQIIRYFPQTGLLTRFTQSGTDKAAYLQPVSPKKRTNAADASIPALTWIILLSTGLTGGGLLGKKFLLGF
ncbi:MAG: hypothetical protein PHX87_04730 [Candidatus Peribacteraceae bacterium]|nr:hypothetical protein [Candidatus Peribacteraceae bacterium]MDD5742702.1 hypothetical protein [Candidatus Peribacteraceae bacterium]